MNNTKKNIETLYWGLSHTYNPLIYSWNMCLDKIVMYSKCLGFQPIVLKQ